MRFLNRIVADLRDKRPLAAGAAVLAAALVAVPVLLLKSTSSTPPVTQAPATVAPGPPSAPAGLPVLSAGSTPSGVKVTGAARDPFTQLVKATGGTTIGTTSAGGSTGTAGGASATGSASSSGSSSSSSHASSGGSATSTASTPAPATQPAHEPVGLSETQSYGVKLAITNAAGGLNTLYPLKRLSVLPSVSRPLLVELGVLKGGKRVLFAVQPGAVVGGPGQCIPGPIDCEILSLAQGQSEALGSQATRGVQSVALFAVAGIKVVKHASARDANQARQAFSAAGRALLNRSASAALSLFRYEPSLGAILDLRNLSVAG